MEAPVRDPYATWQPELATMLAGDGRADTLIVSLVEALRARGLTTYGSCQGHDESECVSKACVPFPDLCHSSHPGQLSLDAKTLDPISALRIEGPLFTQIACMTYPRFVWHFQWRFGHREEAIGRLFDLEPAYPASGVPTGDDLEPTKNGKEVTP